MGYDVFKIVNNSEEKVAQGLSFGECAQYLTDCYRSYYHEQNLCGLRLEDIEIDTTLEQIEDSLYNTEDLSGLYDFCRYKLLVMFND